MSTNSNYRRYPSSWGPVVAVLLILGGMGLLILGSILYASPIETRQPLAGMALLIAGAICLVTFALLLLLKRKFLFPP
jgi:uncharacterized membrane protein